MAIGKCWLLLIVMLILFEQVSSAYTRPERRSKWSRKERGVNREELAEKMANVASASSPSRKKLKKRQIGYADAAGFYQNNMNDMIDQHQNNMNNMMDQGYGGSGYDISTSTGSGFYASQNNMDDMINQHQNNMDNMMDIHQNNVNFILEQQQAEKTWLDWPLWDMIFSSNCNTKKCKAKEGNAFINLMKWPGLSPALSLVASLLWWRRTYTYCRFCEKRAKKIGFKEHRQNCFTENIDKIKGLKEAPLPKECPKDENHVLYQWPKRHISNHSMFECEDPNCDSPDRMVAKKGGEKIANTVKYGKYVKWSEGKQ
jgi:hypothetical protein